MDKERYPETFSCSDFINKNDLQLVDGKAPIWWNYFLCGVKGVVGELLQNDDLHSGSNGANEENHCGYIALMDGKIPPSAGLSSSSAVVVAAALSMFKYSYNVVIEPRNHKKVYLLFIQLPSFLGTVWACKLKLDRSELAGVCARSERFIGTQGKANKIIIY